MLACLGRPEHLRAVRLRVRCVGPSPRGKGGDRGLGLGWVQNYETYSG